MGKKNRKQRRERKAQREVPNINPYASGASTVERAMELLKTTPPIFFCEPVDVSTWGAPKRERKSTLPPAYTDLLKVEAPRAKRYTMIPPHARSRPVEDFLEFHKSAPAPKRIGGSLVMEEPPLAMVCPECSVRRPFSSGRGFSLFGEASGFDACKYCGVHLTVHGTRLMWWR